MAKRDDARYAFGIDSMRLVALNSDLSQPAVDNIIGGVGPFDFTGETATAVPLTVKIDTTSYDLDVDISTAADQSAVTVDELVTALTAVFTSDSVPLTAEKDSTTDRLKISATGTPSYVQVYDTCAELADIGQGFGIKYIYSDTINSVGATPNRKDAETFTVTNGKGLDTEVLGDGQYKGESGSIVDTAEDFEIKALLEGLHIADDGSLDSPTGKTYRPYFRMEVFYNKYKSGQNREDAVIGMQEEVYYRCKGMADEKTREREFTNNSYSYTALTWVDDNGISQPAYTSIPLTVAEFDALLLEEI